MILDLLKRPKLDWRVRWWSDGLQETEMAANVIDVGRVVVILVMVFGQLIFFSSCLY